MRPCSSIYGRICRPFLSPARLQYACPRGLPPNCPVNINRLRHTYNYNVRKPYKSDEPNPNTSSPPQTIKGHKKDNPIAVPAAIELLNHSIKDPRGLVVTYNELRKAIVGMAPMYNSIEIKQIKSVEEARVLKNWKILQGEMPAYGAELRALKKQDPMLNPWMFAFMQKILEIEAFQEQSDVRRRGLLDFAAFLKADIPPTFSDGGELDKFRIGKVEQAEKRAIYEIRNARLSRELFDRWQFGFHCLSVVNYNAFLMGDVLLRLGVAFIVLTMLLDLNNLIQSSEHRSLLREAEMEEHTAKVDDVLK